MRDNLRRLACGHFVYDNPKLHFKQDNIELNITKNVVCEQSFDIVSREVTKGVIWSSNERVKIIDNMFLGTVSTIHYIVDTNGLQKDDVIKGKFDVISNAGEYFLEYAFTVTAQFLKTNENDIADLFQFANFTRDYPEEAVAVFLSDNFNILIENDTKLSNIYEALKKENNTGRAIEEFLVAAGKKSPVSINLCGDKERSYICSDDRRDTIALEKNAWGYIEADICVEADFISMETKHISAQNFTGNKCELAYIINYEKLHDGYNYGRIIINTYNHKIVTDIEVKKIYAEYPDENTNEIYHDKRKLMYEITKNYLDYRMKKFDTGVWAERSANLIERLRTLDYDNPLYMLMQAQVYNLRKMNDEAQNLIEQVQVSKDDAFLYSYYLYVKSMLISNAVYTAKAAIDIKNLYENGNDDWRILWIRFYVDLTFGHNQSIKLMRIKESFRSGCKSGVMYMEALNVMNNQPHLLRVLDKFEIQVLTFGCKNNIVSEKLALHAAQIAVSDKNASNSKIELLKNIYKIYEKDEVLTSIISYLICAGSISRESNIYYEKGILRGIKITRLYEYYIKSLDKNKYPRFSKLVLMYFAYDASLDYENKSFLYADVLFNEAENEKIMEMYMPLIDKFAYEQLRYGRINNHLILIYKRIWNKCLFDEYTASSMMKILYTYKIKCYEENVKAVWVKHKEYKTLHRYEIINKCAFVPIYTKDAVIIFESESGEFFKDSFRYDIEKVFENKYYEMINESMLAYQYEENDIEKYKNIILYEQKKDIFNEEIYEAARCIINDADCDKKCKKKLNSWLIKYFEKSYDKENYLADIQIIDTDDLDENDAVRLIYASVDNNAYSFAFSIIKQYGICNANSGKISELARHILGFAGIEDDDELTQLCEYAFENKKYNADILENLEKRFNGTNEQMLDIWNACKDYDVFTGDIEERIVAQMLFTKSSDKRLTDVFDSYVKNGGHRTVIAAYAAYNAFMYFVKHREVDIAVFDVIEELIMEKRAIPDVCVLAYLKYYSLRTGELTESKSRFIYEIIKTLCAVDKCFEFYKNYSEVFALPYNMTDRTFAEYEGNPDSRVEIHYWFGESSNEYTEILSSCGGYFVKGFTLFYSESVRYYFVEEIGSETRKSDIFHMQNNVINKSETAGRFDSINKILSARQQHDPAEMKKCMYDYCVQDYVTQQIFKPM